jgi:FkbM family methyltransferase
MSVSKNLNRVSRLTDYLLRRLAFRSTVTRELGGVPITFHFASFREFTRSWQYARKDKDPEVKLWVEQYFQDGDVFYDIGSNTGGYALFVAKKLPNTRAVSFEPNPTNLAAINYNAYLNGLSDRLSAFCVAVSERSGVGTFRFRNEASLHIAGYAESVLDSETERFSESVRWKSYWVQLINLDSFVATSALPVPTHVKIDVDGHEFDVLQGMRDLLQRGELKSLLIELDQDDTKIDRLLLDAGFERRQLQGVRNAARSLAIENRLYVRGL